MRAELVFWYCLYYALWLCPDHTKDDLNNKHVKSSGTAQIINHKIRLSTSLFGNTQYDIIDEDKQKNVNYSLYSRYTSAYAVCFHLEMQKKKPLNTSICCILCIIVQQYNSIEQNYSGNTKTQDIQQTNTMLYILFHNEMQNYKQTMQMLAENGANIFCSY